MTKAAIRDWCAKIGAKGGASRSDAKVAAAQRNGRLAQRPHIRKTRHFKKVFAERLIDNEWDVKWPIGPGKIRYNPDFQCPSLNCFIELVTSMGNLYSGSTKWGRAIKMGYPLRVFWWEGQEITSELETFSPKKKKQRDAEKASTQMQQGTPREFYQISGKQKGKK